MLPYIRGSVNSPQVFSSSGVDPNLDLEGPTFPKGAVCQDTTNLHHVVVGRGGCTPHADVTWPQPLPPSR